MPKTQCKCHVRPPMSQLATLTRRRREAPSLPSSLSLPLSIYLLLSLWWWWLFNMRSMGSRMAVLPLPLVSSINAPRCLLCYWLTLAALREIFEEIGSEGCPRMHFEWVNCIVVVFIMYILRYWLSLIDWVRFAYMPTSSVHLHVCMSTQISVIIRARNTKFGMRVPLYYMQININSNAACHFLLPRKSPT